MSPATFSPADRLTAGPVAAYVTLCVVWGSTFLALRVAVETLPPWTMVSVRCLGAGILLAGFAWARGARMPNSRALISATLSGLLMFTCSQAILAWAEIRMPSGPAAVIGCTVSLLTPMVSWALGASARPSPGAIAGLVLGFAGVAVLVHPDADATDSFAVIILCAGSLAWSLGAAIARLVPPGPSPLLGSGLQLLGGGIGCIIFAIARGEWANIQIDQISLNSLLATLYLVLIGSLLAFACFGWLVQIWRPERLSTYAFVNPVIALALGALFMDEKIGLREAVATVLILGAVALTMFGQGRPSFLKKRSKKLLPI